MRHSLALNLISAVSALASVPGAVVVVTPKEADDIKRIQNEGLAATIPRSELQPPAPRGTKSPRLCTVEEAMERTGTTTPRAAKEALSREQGRRLVYMPHIGAKQRAKAARALEREKAKAAK